MNSHKYIIGLALLSVIAICSLGAASASAAGTTTFTCVKGGGSADFSDAHCDNEVAKGTGEFGHVEIAAGVQTGITGNNNKTGSENTSGLLKTTIAGIAIEKTCETETITGSLENRAGPPMSTVGEGTITFSGCKLLKPESQASKCAISIAPIPAKVESVTNLGASGNEMGAKITPKEGETFTTVSITEIAPKCSLKGEYKITGYAIATSAGRGSGVSVPSTGATGRLTTAMTGETLKFAGNKMEVEGTLTSRMEGGGNPLVATTTS